MRELAGDPIARFARIAANDEAQGCVQGGARRTEAHHAADDRTSQSRDGLMVEWILAGLAAHAIGSKQSGH